MNEMFCPNCSQQQASNDVRFCSRCGFQMHVVARLLETGGVLQGFEPEDGERLSLYRRITSSAGSKVIFASVVIFIFTFLLALFANAPELLVLPFFLFVTGASMIVYKLIFGAKSPAKSQTDSYKTKAVAPNEANFKLPPNRTEPVSFYQSPRRTTGDMRQPPPSVTEPTTRLFKSEGETNDL